jgi:uncharacterized membrane protein YGL010W
MKKMTDLKGTVKRYLDQYAAEHTRLSTKLTHIVGIPMIVVSIPTVLVNPLLAAGLFAGGWALQLVGHYVFEGNGPTFLHHRDPVYLLVGPVWVVIELLQLLGVPLPEYLVPGGDTAPAKNGQTEAAAAPGSAN